MHSLQNYAYYTSKDMLHIPSLHITTEMNYALLHTLFHMVVASDGSPPDQDYGFNAIRNERIIEKHRRICYNQTVYDDTRLEAAEYFELTLEVQDLVEQGGPTTGYTEVDIEHAAIRIIDDDGNFIVGVSEATKFIVPVLLHFNQSCVHNCKFVGKQNVEGCGGIYFMG